MTITEVESGGWDSAAGFGIGRDEEQYALSITELTDQVLLTERDIERWKLTTVSGSVSLAAIRNLRRRDRRPMPRRLE